MNHPFMQGAGAQRPAHPFSPATAAIISACILYPAVTLAASPADTDNTTLAPITVKGESTPSALDPQLAGQIHRVTEKELDAINIVNTEDALKYLPNFGIRKRYIGDANSLISVRGTNNRQSARGLVYADGLLLSNFLGNDYSFAPKWSMVFPEDIEQVETFYGPFSALYPGNSLGATVAITTRMPSSFQASAKSQFFSQQFNLFGVDKHFDGSQASAQIGDKVGNASFLIGVDHLENTSQPMLFATAQRSTGASRPGDIAVTGAQPYTDQKGQAGVVLGTSGEGVVKLVQDQFKFKLAYDLTPTLQAGFSLGYWNRRYQSSNDTFLQDMAGQSVYRGGVSIDGNHYDINPAAFAESRGQSESALYGLSLKTRHERGWNYSAYFSYFDILADSQRTGLAGGPNNGAGTIGSSEGSGWKTLDVRAQYTPMSNAAGSHTVTLGYHYDQYELRNKVFNTDHWKSGGAATLNNAFAGATLTQALYAQDAWKIADRWMLTIGLRYEAWKAFKGARTKNDSTLRYDTRANAHISPKASLAYEASDALTLRASIGQAYRFPTVSELFQGEIKNNLLVNNDPNLKPENALSKELAAEWYTEQGYMRLAVFQDDIRDALYSQTDTTVFPNITNIQNIDKVRNRGVELSYQAENFWIKGLDLNAGAGYTHSKILENSRSPETAGNYFPRVPRWRLNAAATYHFNLQTALTVAGRYSGRQYNTAENNDINPNTYGGTSSFFVLDTKLRYQFSDRIEASIGIDNLFNKQAFVFHPYPGRTLFGELKIRL